MRNGTYNGNGKHYINLSELEIATRNTEAEERAIIATIFEALVNEDIETVKELLHLIDKYDLKSSDFSMDYTKSAYKTLKRFLLTHDEKHWNWVSFRDWCEKNDKKEDFDTLRIMYEDDYGDAVGVEAFEEALKIIKEHRIRSELWIKALSLLSDKKPDPEQLIEELTKLVEETKREVEVIKKSKKNSLEEQVSKLFTPPEVFEKATEREWLIPNFLPKNTLIGISAKFGTGKSLLILLLLKRYILPQGIKAIVVDMDNFRDTLGPRVNKTGLMEYVRSGQLKFVTRETANVHVNSEDWKLLKEYFLSLEEHHVIVIDTLKDFAAGMDLNTDDKASKVMQELKEVASKHTVIFLHHIPKNLNEEMPFKNSTTIADMTEFFFFLQEDKTEKNIKKLTPFKARAPVNKKEFRIYENEEGLLDVEDLKPSKYRELETFVKLVYKAIEEGHDTKRKISSYVAENSEIGEKKARELLEKYEGKLWVAIQGEKAHYKVYKPLMPLQKALNKIEHWLSKENVENSELGNQLGNIDFQQGSGNEKPIENQELGNGKNLAQLETLENHELGKPNTIYREKNCPVESNTLKFEEETKNIQEVLKELLEYSDYVDLGSVKIYDPHEENAKEIARDSTLKAILLELYIAHESGEVKGWDYLIEEVKEGKKTSHQALKEFLDVKDIDF
ncbi:MAG: hypothetical protein DSY42_04485 [Aquifex sp.]|nr:MAG: hypothetical protein DSY42_04485 [Aquifex sp.]